MVSRFDMAAALVQRAMNHEADLDHGTPFEDAIQTGNVSVELRVGIKEVFDHLRSALDYCACEIYERVVGVSQGVKIYFPIAQRGARREDFPPLANSRIPGLLHIRPDLIEVLGCFQEFVDPANGWLPDFATLSNENKHGQLSVARRNEEPGIVYEAGGVPMSKIGSGRPTAFIACRDFPSDGRGDFTAVYVSFAAIDQEVRWYLQTAVQGTGKIVERLRTTV